MICTAFVLALILVWKTVVLVSANHYIVVHVWWTAVH